jgi:phosphoglycerate dehydrogenase-like enzyme
VAVRGQQRGEWVAAEFENRAGLAREVTGSTLGIVGYGGIGREVGRRARALGIHVLAMRRRDAGGAEGIEMLRGHGALDSLLERSDAVVICVPSTTDTRGLIGARELARMRPNAILINVSRGDVVDENALAEALRTSRLRGAGLDVFRTEPLPATSPLWALDNVLITPHVSATTDRFWDRQAELIADNTARYLRGEPLRNLVDKRSGY